MAIEFDISVYATNEAETLADCITAIDNACRGYAGRISVLLNGTTDQSVSILRKMKTENADLAVLLFPIANKANAINHFLYEARDPAAAVLFFVDAYVTIGTGALCALADALAAHQHAQMAYGVPREGRWAKAIAEDARAGRGTIQGNLYAMRRAFADRLVTQQLRVPLGIYWGDALLAAMAKHDLRRPGEVPWDDSRVIGVVDADFITRPRSPFRWRDIQRQYAREIRQARGRMENAAMKAILYRDGFSGLPADGNSMTIQWLRTQASPFSGSWRRRFFTKQAIKKIPASPYGGPLAPELVLFQERASRTAETGQKVLHPATPMPAPILSVASPARPSASSRTGSAVGPASPGSPLKARAGGHRGTDRRRSRGGQAGSGRRFVRR